MLCAETGCCLRNWVSPPTGQRTIKIGPPTPALPSRPLLFGPFFLTPIHRKRSPHFISRVFFNLDKHRIRRDLAILFALSSRGVTLQKVGRSAAGCRAIRDR